MDGEEGAGSWRDRRLHARWIDTEVAARDIGEHGRRPCEEHRVCRGDEGERRGHDFVALSDPVRKECEVQSSRAGGNGDRVFHPDPARKSLLERSHDGPLRKLAAFENLHHRSLLFVADHRMSNLDTGLAYHGPRLLHEGLTEPAASHWYVLPHASQASRPGPFSRRRRPHTQTLPASRAGLPATRP